MLGERPGAALYDRKNRVRGKIGCFGGVKYLCSKMLRFSVLGSGSGGNSAVLCAGNTKVLIDAGLSARQLVLRLAACGIDADQLDAVLLTHEHGDHVSGLDVFCRKRQLPVFGTAHTCELVREKMRSTVSWKIFEAGSDFQVGELDVKSFSVPHDAVDPVGFVLSAGGASLGVLSDVGHVTAVTREHLRDLDGLFVEANYDETMLHNDLHRPWATKQRISSRHGHLSNDQTADLVAEVATERLRRVFLGHLSSDCNCPLVAAAAVKQRLDKRGFSSVEVVCAQQREALPMRDIGEKNLPPKLIRPKRAERAERSSSKVAESAGEYRSGSRPARQAEWSF